jgi:1,4-dihydroxy-2-naphthoyl-CoA hydrolase
MRPPMPPEISLPDGVTFEQAVDWSNDNFPGTLMERLEIEIVEMAPDRIVARMPVEGNTQVYGFLHGGATAALCETIASYGTAFVSGVEKIVTGVELNVNHIRAVREGHVTATGTPLHLGRTTAVWDMKVHDDEGRLVAASRLTLAIRDSRR